LQNFRRSVRRRDEVLIIRQLRYLLAEIMRTLREDAARAARRGVGPKTSALIKVGRSLNELPTQRLSLAKSRRHRITGPLYDAVGLFSCDRPIWPLHVAQSKAFPAPVWDAGCKRMRDLLTRVVGLFAWATIFCISARVARPCSEWCSNRSIICFRA
jgi:hypothetical protein